jgi:hypothetical protein
MADKRISQLTDRGTVANSDVVPIVVSGASTTNKATISSIQTFMQGNLDLGVTSVGLSMPSAFTVTGSPVTSSGNISVVGAGTVSQYIRGDGSLADFPQGGGGGGASVSYYLNLSVSQGSIGGIGYSQISKVPVFGAGTDTAIASNGYIASFITDAGDPALLQIPGGNWNFETFFNANSNAGSPKFYIELYKVNSGGTATLIASNSATPEDISFGTTIHAYFSALAVPTTTLTLTDRLALRYYVLNSGRTITLHTENSHLCQVITTFTTGLTALNGLTAQVQNFATGSSGTDFTISSSTSTHTFNIPSASATNRGLVTTGSQTFAGAKTFNSDILANGITVGKGGSANVNNTAVGSGALSANTTGSSNTATGLSALLVNTGGNANTANGYLSLQANTTGGSNASVGNQSLYSNTTGSNNTAVGNDSLYSNITGGKNTGIGAAAGYYIADGSTPNTTSDFSIYLGADTKASVDNAQNETVIGYNAIGSGSNTVTIGNSSVTDNYFTGTVRSTSLRLAAAGTADPTFFRNTSGTNLITSNANVLGFNSVNNIFVTTHSRGGFILGFNNSVSNREYNLQDASGTLAFTTDISSALTGYVTLATDQTITGLKTFSGGSLRASSGGLGGLPLRIINAPVSSVALAGFNSIGFNASNNLFITRETDTNALILAFNNTLLRTYTLPDASGTVALTTDLGSYLPLAGGTLTGALNGTSANFSGSVGIGTITPEGSGLTVASGGILVSLDPGAARKVLELYATSTGAKVSSSYVGASSYGSLELLTSGLARLTIADTGTATFSTSENQGGVYVTSATDNTTLRISSTAANGQEWRLQSTGGSSGLGAGKLIFKVGGTETASHIPLTLTTDNSTNGGRVGIGTASPANLLTIEKSSNSGSGSTFPRLAIKNTLATQGDGSSTFNFADILVSSGNESVNMFLATTFAAGTWAPAGIINVSTNHDLQIKTNNTERMRITSGGYVKASTNGSTAISLTGTYHEFVQNSVGSANTYFYSTGSTQTGANIIPVSDRSNSSAYTFLTALSSGGGDTEFILRGDGNAYADGSWTGGGADYAEYFEWSDGNVDNEDRRGYSVSLINDKIKIAEEGDLIIGVISGNASVIGDSAWNMWNEKYLRDDFQTYIRDKNGDRILNPNFDPDSEYIPREKRPEWGVVGLVGKLCIIKGQPTMPNWIKLKNISDTVEQWLIK